MVKVIAKLIRKIIREIEEEVFKPRSDVRGRSVSSSHDSGCVCAGAQQPNTRHSDPRPAVKGKIGDNKPAAEFADETVHETKRVAGIPSLNHLNHC